LSLFSFKIADPKFRYICNGQKLGVSDPNVLVEKINWLIQTFLQLQKMLKGINIKEKTHLN
jgi:hypothetical protein